MGDRITFKGRRHLCFSKAVSDWPLSQIWANQRRSNDSPSASRRKCPDIDVLLAEFFARLCLFFSNKRLKMPKQNELLRVLRVPIVIGAVVGLYAALYRNR